MTSQLITNKKEILQDLISSSQAIGIVIGENQTIDTVGGALGLYLALLDSGKNIQIISKKDPIVELSNLVGINKITKSFSGDTRILTISVPYREDEIEKVSYNIEGDKLNVNLFAEENGISFTQDDIKYIKKGSAPSLIITVGVSTNEELKELVSVDNSIKIINIDVNPLNALDADVVLADPSFSSISEIVTDVILDLGLKLDVDASQNLMDGIMYATRNFSLPATSAFAFEAAGLLMQSGARRRSKEERRPNLMQENTFPKQEQILNKLRQEQRNSLPQIKNERAQKFEPQIINNTPIETPSAIEDVEKEIGADVPSDWFMPKVFKGTKKGN